MTHFSATITLLAYFLTELTVESLNPPIKTQCSHEAFITSLPFQDKIYLHPSNISERRGDWYYNRAYCAQNCAQMVILHTAAEHIFFYDFMKSVGMEHPGTWLGAQINEKRDFSRWYNGEAANDYLPVAPGEYNEEGLTCLDIGWNNGETYWRNYYCAGDTSNRHYVACQRPASTPVKSIGTITTTSNLTICNVRVTIIGSATCVPDNCGMICTNGGSGCLLTSWGGFCGTNCACGPGGCFCGTGCSCTKDGLCSCVKQ